MKRLPKHPSLPSLTMRRVLPQKRPFSPSSSPIANDLQSRPPKLIPDYLSPMPSHLLATTLCDLLHAPTPLVTHDTIAPRGPPRRPPPSLLPDPNGAVKTGP
ncbi:hypothetical protein J3459_009616 [Metarhizium acridum]|nr:hypothetical protein J3459_009616 [Metarhizium acridum]